MTKRTVLMFVMIGFAGCGSGGPPTVRDFESALSALQCRARFTCCAQAAQQKWTDEAGCRADFDAGMATKLATTEADLVAGTARYDAAAAQKLLDTGGDLIKNCAQNVDVSMFLAELDAVVVGVKPAGSACQPGHVDCAPGTACVSGSCMAQSAPPTRMPDGSACTSGAECKSTRCTQSACASVTVNDLICVF